MRPSWWPPVFVLTVGAVAVTVGVRTQRSLALRAPLAQTVPVEIEGYRARELRLSDAEIRVAGVTSYLARVLRP